MAKTIICAASLLTSLASAQTPIVLDSPLERQVFQRSGRECAEIPLAGAIPAGAAVVEAKTELGAGLRGQAADWAVVAEGSAIKKGRFAGTLKVATGGWYTLKVRFRQSTGEAAVLGETAVEHVGVGDVFVIAGQSNAANHGQERQNPRSGLVAAFDGQRWRIANDPQPGASGDSGSFIPAFGDAVAAKTGVPVGIIACALGGTSVREWLPKGTTFPQPPTVESRVRRLPGGEWESKGEAFDMFTSRMKQLGPHGFRAVLWHQGESDARQPDPKRSLSRKEYRGYLEKLIADSRREIGWDAPWFVALVSSHGGDGEPEIRAAQKSLWDDRIALEGPDSDALRGDLRTDVHFSAKGLRVHGERWAEKITPWLDKHSHNPPATKPAVPGRG